MIRVLIVDDQNLIREGLTMMLSLYDNIFVVDKATNGRDAIDVLKDKEVDLVLMDIRMPIMNGVEATRIIKENYPHIKILILTTFNEDEYIFEGLKNGADGYLLKDLGSDELVKAIETVYSGNVLLQGDIARRMINSIDKQPPNTNVPIKDNKLRELTKKEYEVAMLIGDGKSNKEVAEILFITEGTVKNHINKIFEKLNITNRTQLSLIVNMNKNAK